MIELKHVTKKFNDRLVLDDINLSFDDKGLYFILGDSGCGKTTLLNTIAGLIDYEGEIYFNNKCISTFNEIKRDEFRLKNMGFVFQDFKLFPYDTAIENISFPLECVSNVKKAFIVQKAKDLLSIVGIKDKKDEAISSLSGGEKQRVAIARSLVNDPKVLLCDEPTGALDSKTSKEIMSLLKEISKKRLIIIVSHDQELAQEFANYIITIKDGKIDNIKNLSNFDTRRNISIFKNEFSFKRPNLPFSFLYRHTKNSIKKRKIRTIFTNMITSLGIAGIGLAFVLSDIIKSNIMQVYSSIIEDDQLLVTSKFKRENEVSIIGATHEDTTILANRYNDYINGYGICYYAPFEQFFPDSNVINFTSHGIKHSINSYSVRNINEFVWMEDCTDTIYPYIEKTLNDDEIVLSLSFFEIKELCSALRIEKRVEALADYLKREEIYLTLDLANLSWNYEDQQIFRVKGFTISNVPTIYHSNPFWNVKVLEDDMRFPVNSNFSQYDERPWCMKKVPYLKVKSNSSNFYNLIFENDDLSRYIFQLADEQFYPWLYADTSPLDIDRLMIFMNTIDTCQSQDWKYFENIKYKVKNPIFSSYGGYSIYGSAMLVGFANPTYFAANRGDLDGFLDLYDEIDYENNEEITLPKGIMSGHFSTSNFDGITVRGLDDKNIIGNPPQALDEIVISTNLSSTLFGNKNGVGNSIYLSSLTNYIEDENKRYSSFQNDELKVVGIVEENKNIIYQNEYWTLSYFLARQGVSGFNLLVTSFTFELDNKNDQEAIIKELGILFPQYYVINPLNDISKGIDDVCYYLEIALTALSFVAIVISLFLISINDYLHIKEKQRDFGLIRCIGINKYGSSNLLYFHSIFLSLMSYGTACVELFVLSLFGNLMISKFMGTPFIFKFNLFPYIIMLLLAFICGLLPAFFISFKLKKLNPIDAMKN